MESLQAGLAGRFHFLPDVTDTASALGNTGVDAVSTPSLILFAEQACHNLIAPHFAAGEGSVGTRVAVDHVGAAFLGCEIDVEATLDSLEDHKARFSVVIDQAGKAVMRGSHERAIVDLARFGAGLGRAAAAVRKATHAGPVGADTTSLEFWFDFNSPWCYLAAARLGRLAALRGLGVRWRPVHLANLIEAVDGRRPLESNPAFVAWYRQDLADCAELQGLTLKYHPRSPLRPSRALRAVLAADEEGCAAAFTLAVMRAYWSGEFDLEDLDALAELAHSEGLDPGFVARSSTEPVYKERLSDNLREAVEKGLFGLPTVVRDRKLYFGNDRLDLLERHLDSGLSDS